MGRVALLVFFFASLAGADTITLGGVITQSTQDSGTPAIANPSLNNIADGDPFGIVLTFSGSTVTAIQFFDPFGPASESAFISGSITFTANQVSVLGCLIDAVTCLSGNELDLNFQIPVQPIPGLLPMDLLEDGGNTDIQGSILTYASTTTGQAPEPSTLSLIGLSLAGLLIRTNLRRKL